MTESTASPSGADRTAELLDRLTRLEAEVRDVRASHATLQAAHAELETTHASLLADRTSVTTSAAARSAEDTATPASGRSPVAEAGYAGSGTTSRRMLIGGGLAGAAAVVTGALMGAEPAAATVGAMQFGATNNAGTSGTNLTSTAVDKTFLAQNTGTGLALKAVGVGNALESVSSTAIGIVASGPTIGLLAQSNNGTALQAASTNGRAAEFLSNTASGVRIASADAQLRLDPVTNQRIAPTTDAIQHARGELLRDGVGDLWYCTLSGTPGTWLKLAGPATAGALHVLPTPVRIYDSRPLTQPAVGLKTKFTAAEIRVLDCTVNSSGVPADATAVMLTCLIVNSATGSANFTVWANGQARPSSNTMVWGGTAGRASSLAVTAVGTGAKIQVSPSLVTDLVVDVVGFYR